MGSIRLTDKQKADIVKMYKEGKTVREIAVIVGCSKPSVHKYSKEAGLSRDTPEDAVAKAIQLYQETKLTVAEILEQTGLSKPTFYRKLKKELEGSN